MPITVLKQLLELEPSLRKAKMITMADTDRHSLTFMAGCQKCGASLAPYNSYPSKTGYIQCVDCIGTLGFESAREEIEWELTTVEFMTDAERERALDEIKAKYPHLWQEVAL